MRLPSMMTPVPVPSLGDCFVHGLNESGMRIVEKTFTTAFSIVVVDFASTGGGAGVADGSAAGSDSVPPKSSKVRKREGRGMRLRQRRGGQNARNFRLNSALCRALPAIR